MLGRRKQAVARFLDQTSTFLDMVIKVCGSSGNGTRRLQVRGLGVESPVTPIDLIHDVERHDAAC